MLIAIDVGNTQIAIGAFSVEGSEQTSQDSRELPGLLHSWRIATVLERTADDYALVLSDLLQLAGLSLPSAIGVAPQDGCSRGTEITGIAISSSVPPIIGAVKEMVRRWFDVPLFVVEPGIKTGMPVRYDNPKEVGPDRIVDAVAAVDLYGAPTIVVDLGTATTFNAISAEGEYLGGAIVPGVEISMEALYSHAAALRRVELIAPQKSIGRSTVESIQAGAIFGYAALVDGLCEKIATELGEATVVATGGLSGLIVPHTKGVDFHQPWLTLHGLRLLYARNVGTDEQIGSS